MVETWIKAPRRPLAASGLLALGCNSDKAVAAAAPSAAAAKPAAGGACAPGATNVEGAFCIKNPGDWAYGGKEASGDNTQYKFGIGDLIVEYDPAGTVSDYPPEPRGKFTNGDLLGGKGKWMRWVNDKGDSFEYGVKVQAAKGIYKCYASGGGTAANYDKGLEACKTIVPIGS